MSELSSAPMAATPPDSRASIYPRATAWIYLALVISGLAVVVPRLVSMSERPDYALVSWLGGLIQAAVLLLLGWLILPKRRGSVSTVLLSIVIGATFSAGAAILLNGAIAGMLFEVRLLAPIIEEIVKLVAVAVVLLALRAKLRGPLDGLIVGFFVGFGFAILENILYTYDGATLTHAWQLVITRLITGLGTHVVFTGIAGAALAYLIVTRGRAWAMAITAIVVSFGLHFLWDALFLWVPNLVYLGLIAVIFAAGITVFILVRRMSAAFERRADAGIAA